MSKTVRVGFIGAGAIAGTHIGCLKKIKDVEICALADPSAEACQKRIKDHQLTDVEVFKDYHQLLKRRDLDAVSICTPNWFHYEPAVAALRAGKHVMVEKPLAMNAKEGKIMCDAARKAHKVFTIGFQHRYRPEVQFVRRMVEEGKLGKMLYCRAHALRRRGIPNWGVFGQKKLQGGGPMIDIGVHILDVSLFVMGMPAPVSASGNCYTYLGNKKSETTCAWDNWDYKTYTVEDLACGFVRFKDGSTLTIEASFAAHIEKDSFSAVFMGTKGGAYIGEEGVKVFTDMGGKMVNLAPTYMGKVSPFEVKMNTWIEAIRGGKNQSPAEDGLTIQKILDGVYESAEKGREIRIV